MYQPDELFSTACEAWLAPRNIAPGSVRSYRACFRALMPAFGNMRLNEIRIEHFSAYQRSRSAGPSRINHELNTVSQILDRVNLWEPMKRGYDPLPLPRSCGIALEPEEERHLFTVAQSKPGHWLVAYCASLISNATTCGPGEIKGLRLMDIDLPRRLIRIRVCLKNRFRERDVPLNDDAAWAVEKLLERAREMGASAPEHYLLPHRADKVGAKPDPSRPMYSWKKAWGSLKTEAAKKYPRLARMRSYDLRHNAITKMLENPEISERVVEEMAGHRLGSNVKEKYSHIRMQARRDTAAALNGNHAPALTVIQFPQAVAVNEPPRASATTAPVRSTLDFVRNWKL
jgi:integrase